MKHTLPELNFENLWMKKESPFHPKVIKMWKKNFPEMATETLSERLSQVVYVVCTNQHEVVGVSTSFKAYIPHLKHHLYNYRCFIDPEFRIPGLTSKLTVATRDFLEKIHTSDGPPDTQCIGMITLVENDRIRKFRNEAIWPASNMVYIGNTPKGVPIRAYYFRKALL